MKKKSQIRINRAAAKKKRGKALTAWIVGIFIFVSIMSGVLYMYAKALKTSGIGVELTEKKDEG